MPMLSRTLRCDEARDQSRTHFTAVNIGAVQPARVVPGLLIVGRLQTNQCAKLGSVRMSELQYDTPADRTSHDHRPIELEGAAERADRLDVALHRELILDTLPPRRRIRLSVPGKIESDDPIAAGHRFIAHEMTKLSR